MLIGLRFETVTCVVCFLTLEAHCVVLFGCIEIQRAEGLNEVL